MQPTCEMHIDPRGGGGRRSRVGEAVWTWRCCREASTKSIDVTQPHLLAYAPCRPTDASAVVLEFARDALRHQLERCYAEPTYPLEDERDCTPDQVAACASQ